MANNVDFAWHGSQINAREWRAMSEAIVTHYDRPLYAISVAAKKLGVGVQTLRIYESRGLLEPARTLGGTRRYSERDLERVGRVTVLLSEGLNLVGIAMVLELQDENERLKTKGRSKGVKRETY